MRHDVDSLEALQATLGLEAMRSGGRGNGQLWFRFLLFPS